MSDCYSPSSWSSSTICSCLLLLCARVTCDVRACRNRMLAEKKIETNNCTLAWARPSSRRAGERRGAANHCCQRAQIPAAGAFVSPASFNLSGGGLETAASAAAHPSASVFFRAIKAYMAQETLWLSLSLSRSGPINHARTQGNVVTGGKERRETRGNRQTNLAQVRPSSSQLFARRSGRARDSAISNRLGEARARGWPDIFICH